jgi:pyrroloquinoline-quinone synthase
VYGIPAADLAFFAVHQREDVGHVEQGLDLVSELCTTDGMQREALEAVDRTCRLFRAMYDGMHRDFCLGTPARSVAPTP